MAIANRDAALERAKALAPLFEELKDKSDREIARTLTERKIARPRSTTTAGLTLRDPIDPLDLGGDPKSSRRCDDMIIVI